MNVETKPSRAITTTLVFNLCLIFVQTYRKVQEITFLPCQTNSISYFTCTLYEELCQSICVPLHTGKMLKKNNSLTKLNLSDCKLQPEGWEEVFKGVQDNTKLETLNLSSNTIDDKSASCLGKNYVIQ